MYEGFRRLKALGAETAMVSTSASNEPAIQLYRSAGFITANCEFQYTKKLS